MVIDLPLPLIECECSSKYLWRSVPSDSACASFVNIFLQSLQTPAQKTGFYSLQSSYSCIRIFSLYRASHDHRSISMRKASQAKDLDRGCEMVFACG